MNHTKLVIRIQILEKGSVHSAGKKIPHIANYRCVNVLMCKFFGEVSLIKEVVHLRVNMNINISLYQKTDYISKAKEDKVVALILPILATNEGFSLRLALKLHHRSSEVVVSTTCIC